MIRGTGIDIVDVERFAEVVKRRGRRFLERVFTSSELDYCLSKRRPNEHLAARFAAKESFIKATGLFVSLKDIEVTRMANGGPVISAPGIEGLRVHLSMSHDGKYAVAQTLVEVQ